MTKVYLLMDVSEDLMSGTNASVIRVFATERGAKDYAEQFYPDWQPKGQTWYNYKLSDGETQMYLIIEEELIYP